MNLRIFAPALLTVALVTAGGGASAQDPDPPDSAIYVSMCTETPVASRCVDGSGEQLDTELTALSPDGSTQRVLTTNETYEHHPVFSPGSDRIVFSLGRRGWSCDRNRGLRTMDADGADLEVLTRRSFGCDIATDWSPDGRRILFESECSLCVEVHWISADGEHDERLSREGNRNDPDAYSRAGHWVDGGKGVVYYRSAYGSDEHGVYRVRPDTTRRRRLSPRVLVRDLAVSPNRKLIAFVGSPAEQTPDRRVDVWVMRTDGSNLRRVTDDAPVERDLDWSPDGTTLVFVSGDQDTQLTTVDKDGAGRTALEPAGMTGEYFREYDPHWSPDGTEIVFLAERKPVLSQGFDYAAYVVAADGSYYRRVTEFDQDLRVWGWEPVTALGRDR
jgi:Tol biopolymer transport system component